MSGIRVRYELTPGPTLAAVNAAAGNGDLSGNSLHAV
jgi:hypothetical protein